MPRARWQASIEGHRRNAIRVREILTEDVVSVTPATSLRSVAELLVRHRISGVPVVDDRGRVVGVVSEADIVSKETGPHGGRESLAKLAARTAAEAMTAPAITVDSECRVADAARLMSGRGVNRLPVVDKAGTLAGIVTRADLVRAFVRSDVEIERELREDVVLRTLWIDPAEMWISVTDGEVRLSGKVDTKADAELLEYFASRVPGVVSVHSTLRWRIDKPQLPRSSPRVPIPTREEHR
jgi:CBS domain-containing protein